ncbi:MAG: hypothetical protein KKG59_00510 [Nanoarchaeota archaeon]|nr:hypothetical protein [Nanoarchaeota archaeon]
MKEKYKELKLKYGLPEYSWLNNEFEICQIEAADFLLKDIVKKITEKIEFYAKTLEELFHPESNIAAMHECDVFDSEEKKKMFEVFKRLLHHHRTAMILDLNYSEDAYAKHINTLFKEWPKLRSDLSTIIGKTRNCWSSPISSNDESGYFG